MKNEIVVCWNDNNVENTVTNRVETNPVQAAQILFKPDGGKIHMRQLLILIFSEILQEDVVGSSKNNCNVS